MLKNEKTCFVLADAGTKEQTVKRRWTRIYSKNSEKKKKEGKFHVRAERRTNDMTAEKLSEIRFEKEWLPRTVESYFKSECVNRHMLTINCSLRERRKKIDREINETHTRTVSVKSDSKIVANSATWLLCACVRASEEPKEKTRQKKNNFCVRCW